MDDFYMMKKTLLLTFSIALVALSACDKISTGALTPTTSPSATAEKDLVTISGVVEDEKGVVAKDVTIIVKEDNKIIGTTKTNEKGEFSVKVNKVFGDSYFIEATKELSDGSLNQTLLINSDQQASFTGENKLKKSVAQANPPKPLPA